MTKKPTWLRLLSTALLLCSGCTTVLPSNGSQLKPNAETEKPQVTDVQSVAIQVCGDILDKQAGADCINIYRYLWGPVKEAKLIRADSFDSNLSTTLRYKLIAKSSGCFPVYSHPIAERNYSMDAEFEVQKRGKATVKVAYVHPLSQKLLEFLKRTRNTPGLMGEPHCQAVK